MAVFDSANEDDIGDFGYYDSIKAAKNDWRNFDKPNGAHHAVIEADDGQIIHLGKRGRR
jgi:hypothetical protein